MLRLETIGKAFRVPRVRPRAGEAADPRRERHGRRHDRFWALREVSLAVGRGETLGIIGSNGSGKSTLLKILAGVMAPDSGAFHAGGRIAALLELGAGFHPDLSGIENVFLNGSLLGLTPAQVNALLPSIIQFAELEEFMDMPVRHFSSGMQARLGFAIATALAPEILLLDETFAAGDARFQGKAQAHLAGLRARGHTLVVVSHSLPLLLDMADRVLWLERGRVQQVGPPRDVLTAYQRHVRAQSRTASAATAGLGDLLHGFDLLYEPLAAQPRLRIADVHLAAGAPESAAPDTAAPPSAESQPAAPTAPLAIARGQALRLTLHLQGDPAPGPWLLHAAWARAGEQRVLAESRLLLQPAGRDPRVELEFPGWALAAGDWQLALGLRAAASSPGAAAVAQAAGADPATAPISPWESRWICPRPLRSVTPSDFTVPAFAHVAAQWTLNARTLL